MGYRKNPADIKRGVTAIAAATNFPSGTAPQVLSGASIDVERVEPGTLSALITTTAQTDTLTVSARWQVKDPGGTWRNVAPMNNAANVAIATGTSGTDAAVTLCLPACSAIYAFKEARIQLYTGVGSATTGDLGGATYYYRENSP